MSQFFTRAPSTDSDRNKLFSVLISDEVNLSVGPSSIGNVDLFGPLGATGAVNIDAI